jgi:hypothetical protein
VLALVCALLVLAAVTAAARAPKAVKGATYSGTTSEQVPVTFKVSKSGNQIKAFATRLGYNGHCGQGGGPSYEVAVRTMGIGAGGKFSASAKAGLKGVAAVTPIEVKVSGRIVGRTASGSVAEPSNHCSAPHADRLPYSETFTAQAG